jgi:hypothetical protein
MKSVAKILLLLIVVANGLASCSKEQRMENKLVKGSGVWNIRNAIYNGGPDNPDAGTFEFHKDKTIIKTINLWSTTAVDTGTWSNSEDKIHVTWSDGKKIAFDIKKEFKKNEMTLTESYPVITVINDGAGASHQITSTVMNRYYLERVR